jgi:DNA-binding NarL/FixJ family response regulator
MQYIGILEDNLSLRQSISEYLTSTGNFSIVFSENSYATVKNTQYDVNPDYLILDVHLSDISVIDVISDLKNRFPQSKIIIMTGDENNALLLKSIENGANCFIFKPVIMSELVNIMKQLEDKGSYLEPELLTKLMGLINQKNNSDIPEYRSLLTNRENDVLTLVEQGLTYKEISNKLSISFYTVNHHLKNIYSKLNVNSKLELITKKNK